MMDMYCTLLSFGSISLSVGPLCISLSNAWLSHTGSKHSCTLPFALGTTTKLLHHSTVLSTPRGAMMSSSCSHFSSSLNGFCNTYATHLGGTWYGLLLDLSCNENMPSKHPIPLKTSPYMLCIFCVISLLHLLSASLFMEE